MIGSTSHNVRGRASAWRRKNLIAKAALGFGIAIPLPAVVATIVRADDLQWVNRPAADVSWSSRDGWQVIPCFIFCRFVTSPTSADNVFIQSGQVIIRSPASAATVTLGSQRVDDGRLTVANSSTLTTGFLNIGAAGAGRVNVEAGGIINGGEVHLGDEAGGVGGVSVSDPGSTWNTKGHFVVGNAGTGTLSVSNGGTVNVSGSLILGQKDTGNGVLIIGARSANPSDAGPPGTIDASSVMFGLGTGVINFNHNDMTRNYVFAPPLIGSGALNIISGATVMTGISNGFLGPTTVSKGAVLVVNGSLPNSPVTNNGTLAGNGNIGPYTGGGVIEPGNSIGTLHVNGNFAPSARATYDVELNGAGQSDRIDVTGHATINGVTVEVINYGGGKLRPGTRYTVLTAAGGLTASGPTTVVSNFAFIDPRLSVDANNAYLTLDRNNVAFADVGQTPNQRAAGAGVESLGGSNPLWQAVVGLDAQSAGVAFGQVSGELHASTASAMLGQSHFLRDAVTGRLRQSYGGVARGPLTALGPTGADVACVAQRESAPAETPAEYTASPISCDGEHPIAVWTQALGAWGTLDGDNNTAALNYSTSGFLAGIDATFDATWRVGIAAGYSRSWFNENGQASSGASDNYHLALYGGGQLGSLGLRAGAALSWHDIATTRGVAFPGFADTLKVGYSARTTQVFGEVGYDFALGRAALEPFAGLSYVNFTSDGFAESGGVAALASGGQTNDLGFSTLGLRTTAVVASNDKMTATLRATVGWRHALGNVTPSMWLSFEGGGTPFSVAGAPIARDSLITDVGVAVNVTPDIKLGFTYSGQFAGNAHENAIKGNLSVRF